MGKGEDGQLGYGGKQDHWAPRRGTLYAAFSFSTECRSI